MNIAHIRPGFTLLEMLAASLLLGLMATLLLSLFNQGEMAWTVGKLKSSETDRRAQSLACLTRQGAETVFIKGERQSAVRLLSAWNEQGDVRTSRPFVRVESDLPEVGRAVRQIALAATDGQSVERVEVIVTSAGADGQWGSEDDLTTAPMEDFE